VYLTKLGKKRIEELEPIVLGFYDRMLHGITRSQIDETVKTLRTIIRNAEQE
jgi:hypothetical protein